MSTPNVQIIIFCQEFITDIQFTGHSITERFFFKFAENNSVWLYTSFVCLVGIFRPPREFFTHIETSPLPVKGYKFLPMLRTDGHRTVRVFYRATPTVTRGICS